MNATTLKTFISKRQSLPQIKKGKKAMIPLPGAEVPPEVDAIVNDETPGESANYTTTIEAPGLRTDKLPLPGQGLKATGSGMWGLLIGAAVIGYFVFKKK